MNKLYAWEVKEMLRQLNEAYDAINGIPMTGTLPSGVPTSIGKALGNLISARETLLHVSVVAVEVETAESTGD